MKVTFYSPGTFVAEDNTVNFDRLNLKEFYKHSKTILQRHGATPYGFSIKGEDGMYFLNCRIETLEEVKKRNDPKDKILIWNMETNKFNRIAITTQGWLWTQPFREKDFNIIEINNEIQIKSYSDY